MKDKLPVRPTPPVHGPLLSIIWVLPKARSPHCELFFEVDDFHLAILDPGCRFGGERIKSCVTVNPAGLLWFTLLCLGSRGHGGQILRPGGGPPSLSPTGVQTDVRFGLRDGRVSLTTPNFGISPHLKVRPERVEPRHPFGREEGSGLLSGAALVISK